MKRYLVMHDYGYEGWRVQAECDTVLEAVNARESDIRNAGGEVIIVEHIPVLAAYRQAVYQQEREAQKSNTECGA